MCCPDPLRDPPSFPTRRSSDLDSVIRALADAPFRASPDWRGLALADPTRLERFARFLANRSSRSEEHTSELQSRLHLVCRLLLEKKKTPNYFHINSVTNHVRHV